MHVKRKNYAPHCFDYEQNGVEIIKTCKIGKILLFIFSKGDPDVRGNDGVYSRYFTDFQSGEGRYDIQIHVDNYRATAYTYQPKIFKGKGTL